MPERSYSQQKKARSNSSKKRSKTNKKNQTLSSFEPDLSCIFPKKKKDQGPYLIIEAVSKNDRTSYVGERDGKRKTFTRGEVLSRNSLFESAIHFYRQELLRMSITSKDLASIDSTNAHKNEGF